MTLLTNQVLPFGEIGLKQLFETCTTWLIPSEMTSKITGSISVVNMTDLIVEKKKISPGIPGTTHLGDATTLP